LVSLVNPSHGDRWQYLNDWLREHSHFWRPAPFTQPTPEWTRHYPELARQVAGLSDDDCQRFEDDPLALARTLENLLPSLVDMQTLTALPSLTEDSDVQELTLPEVRARDMPGRKRLQSGAFAAAVRPLHAPIVDWCCGKGHLARTLLPGCDHPVIGYEWDLALVEDGNRLARKSGDAVTLFCQDVMADDFELPPGVHGVGLHACGELHRKLIKQAVQQKLPRLSVAPCCFHLWVKPDYRPLSQTACRSPDCLDVSKAELKLAVEETVTAPARVRNQVQTFSQWRLGFDGLQRKIRQVDEYLQVPSHPGWVARGDFEQFCRWAAEKKQLTLPEGVDFAVWEDHGAWRLAQVRRHDVVRHLFRRPLELWLVLDYVRFLEEAGYTVRFGTFCDRNLTPRNLMIDAALPGRS